MKSKHKYGVRGVWWSVLAALLTLFAGGEIKVRAFVHPGIPLTIADLNNVKANLGNVPWSSGDAALVADGRSSTNYTMQGPATYVNRNYYGTYDNESQWKNDMQAAYNLARMWFFTDDANFAKKSHDILIAWATTQTSFGGIEASFDLGDYAYRYVGAADILRGTWPGWTPTDTTTMSNFFANVYWPDLSIPGLVTQGSQGMEEINAAVAIAVFNDDTNKFNQVLATFLTDADSGLRASYPNGEVSDTGRDQGHAGLYVIDLAWTAEVFWKQGVDVFSIFDNRIHASGEYFTRYNLSYPTPYIPIGAPFWGLFNNIGGAPGSAGLDALSPNILHAAYAVRKGISTPYVDLNGLRGGDEEGFIYYKVADTSTAAPPTIAGLPATASLTTGLTSADLNGCTPAGSTSYSGGTWTLASGYNGQDPWNYTTANDTVHFAYKQLTGDFTFIARVDAVSNISGHDKAGIMLRDSLGAISERVWVAITPVNTFERGIAGWSDLPYGANAASISSPILKMPYWVKMERSGNIVQTFTSYDGASWAPAGTAGFGSLPGTVYVGLFGSSLTTGTLSTSQISNVRITGGDNGEAIKTPPAPFAVYASPGAGQVPLHWNESFMATNYTVWRSLTNGGSYTQVASLTSTFYLDTNVAPSTTYYYVITAANSAGTSTNSPQDSATTQPTPSAPTGLKAWPGNTKATLLWLPSSGATSYNVKRSTTSGSGYTTVANVSGLNFTDTGLANGTTYYYVISAISAAGEGANSTEVSVTPSASASALIWSGAANGTWDTTTANWFNGGASATFLDGNAAIFDDSAAANTTVNLSASRSPGIVVVNNVSKNYIIGGSAISGTGQLIKQGSGSLTLNGANSYTGGTANNGGTVTIGNSSAFGTGLVTLNGGTLNNSANITVANSLLVSSNGGAILLGSANNFALAGALTGSGNLTIGGPGSLASLYVGFSANTVSNAVITIPNNTGNNQTVVRFSSASAGSAAAAWSIGGAQDRGTTFDFGTGTILFGSLSGSGLIQGNSSGIHTMSVGALNTDSTFSGIIKDTSGTVALTKVGSGKLTLTGVSAYTGGTIVNAGSLVISTVSAANGAYTVANGATLGVNNASSGSAAATSLTLAAGSTLEFQNVASTNTPLIAAGSVTVNSSCTVKITGTNGLVAGNTYPLVSYTGTLSGSFTNLQLQVPSGWAGTLVSNANQIAVSVALVAPPAAPATLTATAGNAQVALSWSASSGATSYNVKRATVNGGPYTTVTNVATTAFTDTGLVNGTTYYYVVSALNTGGESANSAQVSAMPLSVPAAPATLTATVTNAQVALNWSASATATGYNVKRSTTSGSGYALIASTSGTTYTDAGATLNQTYYYVGTATNIQGESGFSPEASATPQLAATWTGATSTNWDTVSANWTASGVPVLYQDGATVRFDDTALSNATINVSATVSPLVMVVSNNTQSYTFSGSPIAGTGSLSKWGSNPLTMSGANTYSGGTTNYSGSVVLGANSTGSGSSVTSGPLGTGKVTLSGGTLQMNAKDLGNNLNAATNTTSVIDNTGGDGYLDGNLSGSGVVTLQNSSGIGLSLKVAFNAAVDWSGFTGTLNYNVANGNVFNVFLPASFNLANATLNTGGSGTPPGSWSSIRAGGTNLLGALSGTKGYLDFGGLLVIGGLNTSTTFGGAIIDAVGLTKVGTGTLTLTGANSYTGQTTVSNGELVVATVFAGNGNFWVTNGATLGVTNSSATSALVSNLTVAAGTALEFQNVSSTTTPLMLASNVIVGGSCTVKITGTNGLVAGGTYPLVNYSGQLQGSFGNLQLQLPAGVIATLVNNANQITLSVTALAAPTAPATLTATPGNAQVALSWSASTGATSYNVKRATVNGGPYTTVTNVTTTSYTDTGLVNGTTYYYVVSALNANGESANSVQASATPQVPAPAAPTGLIAIGGNAQIGLVWNTSSGATSYNVKRSLTSGSGYIIVTNVTTASFTDTGVINGTNYYYVVSALNAGGESGNSTEASATPQVPVPTAPTGLAAVPGNMQATLSWTASSGATSYNVKRSTTSGSGYVTVTNVAGTSVVNIGLTNGTPYYYVVSALNAGGESGNSIQASVTPTDLFGWWKFNETSGTTAFDSGGGGNNGTLASGATWVAGVSSNAVRLDATANGYVSFPAGLVSTLNDFSVVTFVKVNTNATWARVFDFGSGTGTYMFLAPASGGNTVRYAITTSSSGGEQQINSTTVLSSGIWHHVAVTLSGSVGVLYIDGVAVGTNSSMTLKPSSLGSTTQNYIGKSQWADPNLNGSVDDFRIYSRALSASEVTTLASGTLPSPWATVDVGAVAATGAADYVGSTYTIQGAGANIGGAADAFRFVYQPSSGDCSNTVRVASIPNTGANAKAGVMIRETLATGALEAGIWVTPTNGIIFTSRNSTGGSTSTSSSSGKTAPYWLRIRRVSNSFSAYYSTNGTAWTQLGSTKSITMATSAYVGMGVCSGVSNVLNTATMTNVTTVP